jgi:hypothetical protein
MKTILFLISVAWAFLLQLSYNNNNSSILVLAQEKVPAAVATATPVSRRLGSSSHNSRKQQQEQELSQVTTTPTSGPVVRSPTRLLQQQEFPVPIALGGIILMFAVSSLLFLVRKFCCGG